MTPAAQWTLRGVLCWSVVACDSVDLQAVTAGPEATGLPAPPDAAGTQSNPEPDDVVTVPSVSPTVDPTMDLAEASAPSATAPPQVVAPDPPDTIASTKQPAADQDTAQDAGSNPASPASLGCLAAPLSPGDTSVTLQVGGVNRSYVLHVPEAYDGGEPVPLLVDFHGIGETGWRELELSTYPAVTDPEGVIMAFPDGLAGPLGSAWDFGPCCVADVDDFAFARALVNDVSASACIDPDRVYAVGVLTGGGMVQHLACDAADIFAGVAPSAFDLLEETSAACRPSRPITVLSFRATADSRVPYDGGPSNVVPGMPITFLGAVGTLARWGELNECTGPLGAEDERGCAFYTGCADGVDVALCTDYGGDQAPGDAAIAWPVLGRHRR